MEEKIVVKIADITVDPLLNVRDEIDQETVERYAKILEQLPKPILYRLPDGSLLLVAGFHRLEAAILRGWAEYECVVRDGTRAEAEVESATDNALHGKGYNRAERRRGIAQILRAQPERANNWIATEMGVSPNTVAKVREELEASGDIPALDRLVGADGKERARKLEATVDELDEFSDESNEFSEEDGEFPEDEDEFAGETGAGQASPAPASRNGSALGQANGKDLGQGNGNEAGSEQARSLTLKVASIGEPLAAEVDMFINGNPQAIPVTLVICEGPVGGLPETTEDHKHALVIEREKARDLGLLYL